MRAKPWGFAKGGMTKNGREVQGGLTPHVKPPCVYFSKSARYIEFSLRSFSLVPAAAGCGNTEETTVPFFCISAQKEVCAVHPHSLPFAFSEQVLQTAILQFVYAPARKMRDFKGSIPLTLGFQ